MTALRIGLCVSALVVLLAPWARAAEEPADPEQSQALEHGVGGPARTGQSADPDAPPSPVGTDVWLLLTVGLGGGSRRAGPLAAEAGVQADLFLGSFGLGLAAVGWGFGEPDGNGSEGQCATGRLAYRLRLGSSAPGATEWAYASSGIGYGTLDGYERVGGERQDYEFSGVVIPARLGLLFQRRALAVGMGFDALVVPTQGYAVVLAFDVGAALGNASRAPGP